ncbi:TetR/AcrR family transcriptional regulator [Mycolicibacterium rhodesiae]|uniref:TetR family transcriptional regulator n=1 Tax=Mycolicibacterium rhodesiae TaxID=36814 RepID=A0A1X0IJ20_MYCRH|nr:TetR/AcrR family transcriptional regulator [Mycolicibacterium rhodesiae]MCV7342956.1 TetR/AcrR family transcriptional regulator [Mycolicibacterium rhodesiae]ORB47754.1 TetR family transcriptional regulator [Mycolicibacterium rhodesiae]
MTASAGADSRQKSVQERLVDAAESCLRAKGIRATTVSEVAEAAGVSRGWLYRHYPDKASLLGAAIVRLNNAFWAESHQVLDGLDTFEDRLAVGVRLGRSAYDSPGALVMQLRRDEPEEFAACAGAGVQGLVPDLGRFWRPYLEAARDGGEIHAETDLDEAAEWVARVQITLGTVPGETIDPDDHAAVLRFMRRYVLPGLRTAPAAE